MANKIDNRKITANDFYDHTNTVCAHCDCQMHNVYILKDGYDTALCCDCIHLTLEELEFKDDFESDKFKRKV